MYYNSAFIISQLPKIKTEDDLVEEFKKAVILQYFEKNKRSTDNEIMLLDDLWSLTTPDFIETELLNIYKAHQIEDEPDKIYLVSEDITQSSLETNIIRYVRMNNKWHVSPDLLNDDEQDELDSVIKLSGEQMTTSIYRAYYTRTNLNIRIPSLDIGLGSKEKKQITDVILDIKGNPSLKMSTDILGLLLALYKNNNKNIVYKKRLLVFMTNLEKHLIYK